MLRPFEGDTPDGMRGAASFGGAEDLSRSRILTVRGPPNSLLGLLPWLQQPRSRPNWTRAVAASSAAD